MGYILIGIAVAFNILVILWKFKNNRTSDALLDSTLLVLVTTVFSGSYGALVVGTIASVIVSIYLLVNKPDLNIDLKGEKYNDYKY